MTRAAHIALCVGAVVFALGIGVLGPVAEAEFTRINAERLK